MKCRFCLQRAGWFRRRCAECRRLLDVFSQNRGTDFGTMMQLFAAANVPLSKIERFLEADPDGEGTIRDHIAASMTNDLMSALGSDVRQTAADVKRIRERGNWVNLDRRPTE